MKIIIIIHADYRLCTIVKYDIICRNESLLSTENQSKFMGYKIVADSY